MKSFIIAGMLVCTQLACASGLKSIEAAPIIEQVSLPEREFEPLHEVSFENVQNDLEIIEDESVTICDGQLIEHCIAADLEITETQIAPAQPLLKSERQTKPLSQSRLLGSL